MPVAAITRLNGLIRERGFTGLIGFLATRLVRIRRHVVFLKRVAEPAPVDWREDETVLIVRSAEELEMLEHRTGELPPDFGPYRDGIHRGEAVGCFVLVGGTLAHWSFLMYRSRMLCLIGAPSDAVLLGNAYTIPSFRGRGLQTRSLKMRQHLATESGAAWLAVEAAPDNVASRRAIGRVGIPEVGELRVLVLVNHLVFRWGTATRRGGSRWAVCW